MLHTTLHDTIIPSQFKASSSNTMASVLKSMLVLITSNSANTSLLIYATSDTYYYCRNNTPAVLNVSLINVDNRVVAVVGTETLGNYTDTSG